MEEFVARHELESIPNLIGDPDLWADFGARGQPVWVIVPSVGDPSIIFGKFGLDNIGAIAADLSA